MEGTSLNLGRHGKRWSADDNLQLAFLLDRHFRREVIAQLLGRTIGSIESQILVHQWDHTDVNGWRRRMLRRERELTARFSENKIREAEQIVRARDLRKTQENLHQLMSSTTAAPHPVTNNAPTTLEPQFSGAINTAHGSSATVSHISTSSLVYPMPHDHASAVSRARSFSAGAFPAAAAEFTSREDSMGNVETSHPASWGGVPTTPSPRVPRTAPGSSGLRRPHARTRLSESRSESFKNSAAGKTPDPYMPSPNMGVTGAPSSAASRRASDHLALHISPPDASVAPRRPSDPLTAPHISPPDAIVVPRHPSNPFTAIRRSRERKKHPEIRSGPDVGSDMPPESSQDAGFDEGDVEMKR